MTLEVDGALPAMSRSVVAGTNWKDPDRGVVDRAEHQPLHASVTVKVIVRLPLLRLSDPANETERVELLLVRYPDSASGP